MLAVQLLPQSTLRPPDARIVYWKIGIYVVHIGDNDMHSVRTGKKTRSQT